MSLFSQFTSRHSVIAATALTGLFLQAAVAEAETLSNSHASTKATVHSERADADNTATDHPAVPVSR